MIAMTARPPREPTSWATAGSADDSGESELMTGEAVALDVRYASFVLRAAGAAIDWIAYVVLFLGLLLLIGQFSDVLGDASLTAALVIASLVIAIVIAPMSVEILSRGRSLGKLAIGARIVRDDGGAVQARHAFIRALTGVLELFMTFGGLAALVALLSPRAKRLGDLLAGTYSQHERVPRITQPVYGVPPALATWAVTADVAQLPDRLSRRISTFLHQAAAMTPATRAGTATELTREASAYVSPLPVAYPEAFLTAVAAIRRDRDFDALTLERQRLERLAPVLTGLPHAFPDR
jgi:uncharacterized RDD family membrane protein YckC